jgi:hypothetical protein
MSDSTVAAFVVGEPLLVSETTSQILSMFVGDSGQCITVSDIDNAWEEAVNPPFFGNKAIVLKVKSVGKSDVVKMVDIIDHSSDSCLIVIRARTITSEAKKLIKSTGEPTFRFFNYTGTPSFSNAMTFVNNRVSRLGSKISRDCASLLVSIVGSDYWALAQEIDKIMLVTKSFDQRSISTLAFPVGSAEYFQMYSSLRDGDAAGAILESRALMAAYGYESVEKHIMKVVSASVRWASTKFTGCKKIEEHRLSSTKWWPQGKKKGNPIPSSFMSKVAEAIFDRHGESGVELIMRFIQDDIARMRIHPDTRHPLNIEMKILAICGKNGSPQITRWKDS